MDADDIYHEHVDQPYGKHFVATVRQFQDCFLRDKTDDLDEAFAMAVDSAVRLLPTIKIRHELGKSAYKPA